MDFLNFVKEEENIEYSKTLLKICEYFGASQEDLDKIKSKLPNLFTNFWENADQILELDFEEVKKGLENIDIPKDKTKEYINFIGKAFKKYGRKASICLSRINESDFGLNENYIIENKELDMTFLGNGILRNIIEKLNQQKQKLSKENNLLEDLMGKIMSLEENC